MAAPADAANEGKNMLFLVVDDLNTCLLGDADRYTGKVVAPNICCIVGRPIEWNASKGQITSDKEANDLLVKVRRPEFALPTF